MSNPYRGPSIDASYQVSVHCQEDEETIEHLFWNCEIAQAFIDEIDSWLLSNAQALVARTTPFF